MGHDINYVNELREGRLDPLVLLLAMLYSGRMSFSELPNLQFSESSFLTLRPKTAHQ